MRLFVSITAAAATAAAVPGVRARAAQMSTLASLERVDRELYRNFPCTSKKLQIEREDRALNLKIMSTTRKLVQSYEDEIAAVDLSARIERVMRQRIAMDGASQGTA